MVCVSVHAKERGEKISEEKRSRVGMQNALKSGTRCGDLVVFFFYFRFQRKKNERAPSNNFSKRCLLLVSFHLLDVTDILNCIVCRPMYHTCAALADGMVRCENPFVK